MRRATFVWPAGAGLASGFLPRLARADLAGFRFPTSLPPPVTPIAHDIYDLNTLINWVCFGIFLVVFIPMFYALWRHRKSAGHRAEQTHEHVGLEVTWSVIPFLILIGLAIPTTRVILAMKDTSQPDLTVKITGRQWKWEYEYLGEDVKYISSLSTSREQVNNRIPKSEHYLLEVDHPLVVPTGKKIRVVVTAEDVIHSWWVPALGVKQDAIPGFIRDAWFRIDQPGVYRGQCAELCGVEHAYMPVVVEAVEPDKYATWMGEQKAKIAAAREATTKEYALPELIAMGQKVYSANCAACHQANGGGIPGTFPALNGSKVATGPKAAHLDVVFHGRPGTAMAAFGKQLSDVDLAAVVSYERNSWGNKTGDGVQPREVAALRQ